jgi:hypothetical protein
MRFAAAFLNRPGSNNMSKFMVLYRSSASAAEQMANADSEQMQAGMALWEAWAQKAADALVDLGSPLAQGRTLPPGSGGDDHIGGFSILQASSLDEVTASLGNHPHFHAPGASIEVLDALRPTSIERRP